MAFLPLSALGGLVGGGRRVAGAFGAVPGAQAVGGALGAVPGVQPMLGAVGLPGGGGGGPQDQIAALYRAVSGGQYTPTPQDLAQWGPNPDAQYLQQIGPAIQQWWDQNQAQHPTGAQPGGAVSGPSAPSGGGPWGQRPQFAQQAGGFMPLSAFAGGLGGLAGSFWGGPRRPGPGYVPWGSPSQGPPPGYRPPQPGQMVPTGWGGLQPYDPTFTGIA